MRQVPWDRLDGLVPRPTSTNIGRSTLRFLKIAREHWPAVLQEQGRIEPAERRDRLIAAEAKRLATGTGPVIAAGSTGSIPATATLLATIAKLPHGALVLPGLDTDLDDATWKHDRRATTRPRPRMAIRNSPCRRCLRAIGIVRDAVEVLGDADSAWPRTHDIGGIAARRHERAVAGALGRRRFHRAMPTPRSKASR